MSERIKGYALYRFTFHGHTSCF